MNLYCPMCGPVEVSDDLYKMQQRAKNFSPMIGGTWLRCHPLTCECGRELEECDQDITTHEGDL